MHEFSLIAGLLKKIDDIVSDHEGRKLIGVTIKLGVLSGISAGHFREHFVHETRGTIAEGADLTINEVTDIHDPHAQSVMLESVELEE